jgi:phosphoglycolate phosphatase-like HAD superfamily hydrolase
VSGFSFRQEVTCFFYLDLKKQESIRSSWYIVFVNNLLLWDIDGTLLVDSENKGLIPGKDSRSGEFIKAAQIASGRDDLNDPRHLHDWTDYAILADIFEQSGYSLKEKEQLTQDSLLCLEEITQDASYLRSSQTIVPGAKEALEMFSSKCLQTCVTGNSPARARRKLEVFSMLDYFDLEVGGFGSLTTSYNDFVEDALRLVSKKYGEGMSIFLLGNTPREMQSAQEAGIYSVGVTSGVYNAEDLEEYQPGMIIDDFSDDNVKQLARYLKQPRGSIFQQFIQKPW